MKSFINEFTKGFIHSLFIMYPISWATGIIFILRLPSDIFWSLLYPSLNMFNIHKNRIKDLETIMMSVFIRDLSGVRILAKWYLKILWGGLIANYVTSEHNYNKVEYAKDQFYKELLLDIEGK